MNQSICILLVLVSVQGLMPRQLAPTFTAQAVMPDLSFKELSLADYKDKYVVILFYPFDFTYVCPTEIISYSSHAEAFREIGAEVLAISVDSHFSHLAWRKAPRNQGGLGEIQIPLLADITKQISKNYGVLVEDPSDGLHGATLRGLFVIDKKGMVRSIMINDEQVGRNVEETLRLIKAFQHADQHGVVCPANWKPGSKTIIPDQDKMTEYFSEEL